MGLFKWFKKKYLSEAENVEIPPLGVCDVCNKDLNPDEGYSVDGSLVKESGVDYQYVKKTYGAFVPKDVKEDELHKLFLQFAQYDTPYMLCEECIAKIHLSTNELVTARKQAHDFWRVNREEILRLRGKK